MKGVTNIEFVLSVFVFLGTLSFIAFLVINSMPFYRQNALSEDIKAESYQISELLVLDRGEPIVWGKNNVKRIGLLGDEFYVLDFGKITTLDAMCKSNYDKIRNLFGKNDLEINITYLDNNLQILDCKNSTSITRLKFTVTRFAVVNNRIAKVDVSVIA